MFPPKWDAEVDLNSPDPEDRGAKRTAEAIGRGPRYSFDAAVHVIYDSPAAFFFMPPRASPVQRGTIIFHNYSATSGACTLGTR